MGQLVDKGTVVFDDPLNAVLMKVALIKQLAAGIDRQEFARLVCVVFCFDGVCYSVHNNTILAQLPFFVNRQDLTCYSMSMINSNGLLKGKTRAAYPFPSL